MSKKFVSPHDCGDCEWLAFETEGDVVLCNECGFEGREGCTLQEVEDDDGQPDWAQEWEDFGEVYDDEPNYI
jgi:hypothetical protein